MKKMALLLFEAAGNSQPPRIQQRHGMYALFRGIEPDMQPHRAVSNVNEGTVAQSES